MSKDELIAKQQLEIEEFKRLAKENADIIRSLKMRFYAIGQPLNDNSLQFNREQLKWCLKTFELIEDLADTN